MSKYFLVPDLHGELDMATGLLQQEGFLDAEFGRINYDTTLVQMGDFLNCVASSVVDDQRCLDHEDLFDVLLVGNHEHPYFGGPAFSGFHCDYVMMHRLKSLDSRGRYSVALDCDGVLVTHAGVTTELFGTDAATRTSKGWANKLNYLWREDKTAITPT